MAATSDEARVVKSLRDKAAGLSHFFGVDSWRCVAWIAAGWAIVLGLFVVQYSTFGYERYLGWDTSTYVQLAREIQVAGLPATASRADYLSVYVILDWVLGSVSGNIGIGERILPPLMGMLLVALYFRFGREVFHSRRIEYAGLTAVLAALVPNTMRLLSDLHRNLFCLIAIFAAFIVLVELVEGRRARKNALAWILVLSAMAAFSELETYAVFVLVVAVYTVIERRVGWAPLGLTVLPFIAVAPFLIPYFSMYLQIIGTRNPADPLLSFSDLISYHGGVLPLFFVAVLGGFLLIRKARQPRPTERLLSLWYSTLIGLTAFLSVVITALPASRPLYLVPVPILLSLGIEEVILWISRLLRAAAPKPLTQAPPPSDPRRSVQRISAAAITLLVVVGAGAGLAEQKDAYMQPFVSPQQYAELLAVGRALQPYAGSSPVVVFEGYNGTWFYSMDEAYLGALSGPVIGYFGRPQFLYSLTDPLIAEPWLSDSPDPSRFVATQLFEGVGAASSGSDYLAHVVVVSAPTMYDRPVSDYFVVKHRVATGLYIVPPGSVTTIDLSTWVWFAAFDWRSSSGFNATKYSWAISPRVLEYAVPSLSQPWTMDYYMHLPQAVTNANLSIHLEDTPPFPSQWNVNPSNEGSFVIFMDSTSLATYAYINRGVQWVNLTVGGLTAGYHTIRIEASDLGKPFAIGLDALALYPNAMTLNELLAPYAP